MNKKICLYISLLFLIVFALNCSTDENIKTNDSPLIRQDSISTSSVKVNNDVHESFRKVGWIKEDRYRALVFIITRDECYNSPRSDIEAKIKLAAYNSLQHELNPSLNRNAAVQIKKMVDDFGEVIQVDKDCRSENIFLCDIVKNDLKSDFEKIKNTK